MSPLPSQMANRWESRVEPKAGQGKLYWHILFNDQPQVRALASAAQERLAGFPGLHFTPKQWLHMTTMTVGFSEDFTATETSQMIILTRGLLSRLSPITVTFGRVLYHSEAIALGVNPPGAVNPVLDAVREATGNVIGSERTTKGQAWVPHVTVAYSTARQPASPIIAALGHELPKCEATIDGVNLIIQDGPERLWDWRSVAKITLGS